MTIDFRAEVDKCKDALMDDLINLLRINSERDDSQADAEHPFGPGPVKALEFFLEMAERDGYETKNVDNYAGHFTFGQGEEELGILGHLDVVPAGSGWDTDPYEPVIKDNRLYARGSSDDKGPTMACYYALKIIKELGLPTSKKVRFVVGTDEESGWGDMDYYFEHVGLPKPDFGFSPDAEFPIINGEKGNITEYLHFSGENKGAVRLHSFSGGLRENMVPESATARFTSHLDQTTLGASLADFASKHNLKAELSVEDEQYIATVYGKSAHGSTPQEGVNGATYLALYLSQFDFEGPARAFLDVTANIIHEDFSGEKLGVAYEDDCMGSLSMNAGVFQFDETNDDNTIALNFRYPQGTDAKTIQTKLEKLNGVEKVTLSDHEHTPHYVPMDDELVSTLLAVYEKQTGLKGHEQVIGGGTFGRLLERGVAYGAMFPGDENTMHQANEYMPLENIFRSAAIYAEAIYELIK
ncbi:dipeptidase PepV [Streptococcus agalactiae]|uniref:Dipeptidase PepV n=4 Tax=Streptococcus agalactiae TaxID=1311 RepID=A0AAD2WWX6_STRAG|nr:dipeptidase PepV [Streptococcus agalactiae]EPX12173.1 dipeptidase PepV [Streptococcus agalactiae LDS 610]EPT35557.1 dipeptidase PepV [Streptococcus agalactiae FSL S3-277]EPT39076.1 dipeptidase PepV [Streptococcus agalactiae FSL S3-603]EPT40711.1 dipeptidase PepV [Streptococcus agalactiae FSL S3-501]EPT42336.1 dipeptidase PepV [Streptococcus agalactiae FSL C1-494]